MVCSDVESQKIGSRLEGLEKRSRIRVFSKYRDSAQKSFTDWKVAVQR